MTFHKYMNPMLLLQNQLTDPFLWNPVPFLLYHCLHFCLPQLSAVSAGGEGPA